MSVLKSNDELIAEHQALMKARTRPSEAVLPDGRTASEANADFLAREAAHQEELRLQRVALREAREAAEKADLAEVASSVGSAASATEDVPSAKKQPKN